jgi:hypothetical protein
MLTLENILGALSWNVICCVCLMFGRFITVVVLMNNISISAGTYWVHILTFTIFASSDLRHTGSVPTILLTDAASFLPRYLLFPFN